MSFYFYHNNNSIIFKENKSTIILILIEKYLEYFKPKIVLIKMYFVINFSASGIYNLCKVYQ